VFPYVAAEDGLGAVDERVLSVRRLHNDDLAALCGASAESIWCAASTGNEKQITQWGTKSPNATICLDCESLVWPCSILTKRTARTAKRHSGCNGKIKATVGAEGYALGEGIDTRGKGGMIVLAPTKLANGQYEWLNDLEPVELPQRVADLAGTVPARNAAPETKLRRPIRMRNSQSGSIRSRSKNTMASMIFGLN
jgi:hypothetical protein